MPLFISVVHLAINICNGRVSKPLPWVHIANGQVSIAGGAHGGDEAWVQGYNKYNYWLLP